MTPDVADTTPAWGIEPVPERLRVLETLDSLLALDEPRHLAAVAQARRPRHAPA